MYKLKIADYILIFASIILVVLSFLLISKNSGEARLRIDANGKHYYFSLSNDYSIDSSILGVNVEIIIKDNSVRFIDSDCPDKLCIGMAALENEGQWSACLPNRVFMVIESQRESDLDDTVW